jgi:hypothetical protein
MKNINETPGQKQGQDKSGTSVKNADKEKSQINKGKNATGPNWNKDSKGAEGDSGQNAGVFK